MLLVSSAFARLAGKEICVTKTLMNATRIRARTMETGLTSTEALNVPVDQVLVDKHAA